MPAFKRDSASRLRDAERCMKGGEPLTMREASFISSLMGHAQHIDAATVRFTMHIDGSLDGQINLKSEYTRELERAERERAGTNALSARGDGVPPRRSRSSSPDAPPAKRASSAGSSVCGYDSEAPEEIQNEALYRACRAYGLGEQFIPRCGAGRGHIRRVARRATLRGGCGDRPAAQAPRALRRVGRALARQP